MHHRVFTFALHVLAVTFALAQTACKVETKIRDTYYDRTAPDAAQTLEWLDLSNGNAVVNNGEYSRQTAMKASWTPSTTADMTSQGVQLYIGSACNIASGAPIRYSGSTQTNHVFDGLPDGSYSFKVISYDRKSNASYSECSSSFVVDNSLPSISIGATTAWINNANKASYAVNGACTDSGAGINGNVTVRLALNASNFLEQSTPCISGAFSVNLNTTALTLGGFTNGFQNLTLTASVSDQIGNGNTSSAVAVSRDIVAPTLSGINPAPWINSASQSAYAISGSCGDATSGLNGPINIAVTDGTNTVTATATCSGAGNFSTSINVSSLVDTATGAATGNVSVSVSVSDIAGNSTTSTLTRSKDTVAPTSVMKFASNNLDWEDKNTQTGGNLTTTLTSTNCTDQSKVIFTATNIAPAVSDANWATCVTTADAFSRTINSPTEATANVFYAWSKDAADNISASKVLTLTYDITPPTVTGLDVNGTDTTTNNNNTLVALSASSNRTDIWAFCLKYNDTTVPALNSTCWTTTDTSIGIARTQNLSMSGAGRFAYRLGTILGTYDVRMWVRDAAGNISAMSDSGAGTQGTDLDTISYSPDAPPVLSNVIASSTNPPTFPLDSTQTTVANGDPVYIRWNATDNNSLPSNGITIEYTTNESTYTTVATNLNPIGNNGTACTVDEASTGCYQWTSTLASGTYYKFRVSVTDSGVSTVVSHTNGLNSGNVNFLAGNTSLGFDGSANSALFIGKNEATFSDAHDNGALVVTKSGMIFFKYQRYFFESCVWIMIHNATRKPIVIKAFDKLLNSCLVISLSLGESRQLPP